MNIQVTLIVAVVVAVLDSTSTSTSMMKTMMSIAYLHFTICNAVSLVFASHHGFTFVVTWSEQSSRFSNVHLVQDTPSQIVIHNAMNYRAFCFEGLEVLTFFFLSADSRCILPHPWFCRNQITWRTWTTCGLAQVDMGFLSSEQKLKPAKYFSLCPSSTCFAFGPNTRMIFITPIGVFRCFQWNLSIYVRFMVASGLGIAGSGCFSGSEDPAEEGFVSSGCATVSNWCGNLWDNWESIEDIWEDVIVCCFVLS